MRDTRIRGWNTIVLMMKPLDNFLSTTPTFLPCSTTACASTGCRSTASALELWSLPSLCMWQWRINCVACTRKAESCVAYPLRVYALKAQSIESFAYKRGAQNASRRHTQNIELRRVSSELRKASAVLNRSAVHRTRIAIETCLQRLSSLKQPLLHLE